MENEVISYIKEAQKHGLTDLEIKQNLLDAGWEAGVVESSFAFVRSLENKIAPNKDEDIRLKTAGEKEETAPPTVSVSGRPAQMAPQLDISEHHFKNPSGKAFFKRPIFWSLLVIIIMFGAGGYLAYANLYNNPGKIWKNFTSSAKDKIYESTFDFQYSDRPASGSSSSPITFKLSGSGYKDAMDQNNPQSSAEFNIGLSANGADLSKDFKYRLFNKNFYLYFGQLPERFGSLLGDKKYEWLKLDISAFNELAEQAAAKNSSSSAGSMNELQIKFQQKITPIWQQAHFVKMDKYLGKDKIGSVDTFHFKNSLDKEVLAKAIIDTINTAINETESLPDFKGDKATEADRTNIAEAVRAFVNKIEVKELETWIGTKDFRLYKIHLVGNAPSLNAIKNDNELLGSLPGMNAANAKTRDAQRLADLRQMSASLELYYIDQGGYPETVKGKPLALMPNYLLTMPQTPVPADGSCSNYYNTYWYQTTGKAKKGKNGAVYPAYEIYSCLGNDTAGYKAGIVKVTPEGLQAGLPCTGNAEQCIGTNNGNQGLGLVKAQDVISRLDFSAEVRLDIMYSNYGQVKTIEAPAEYFDVLKELQNLLNTLTTKN